MVLLTVFFEISLKVCVVNYSLDLKKNNLTYSCVVKNFRGKSEQY